MSHTYPKTIYTAFPSLSELHHLSTSSLNFFIMSKLDKYICLLVLAYLGFPLFVASVRILQLAGCDLRPSKIEFDRCWTAPTFVAIVAWVLMFLAGLFLYEIRPKIPDLESGTDGETDEAASKSRVWQS